MPYTPLYQETGYRPDQEASLLGDIAAAPFRGVEGALQGVYGFADMLSFDALPDWDERVLGRSQTVVGGLLEGTSQFLVGFLPGIGVAGRIGRATGLSARIASAGRGTQIAARIGRDALVGAGVDFLFLDAHEGRLSDLIQQVPALRNPVTGFLASDEDDSEFEGRVKNVLEGALFGVAIDGVLEGMRAVKAGRKALSAGKSPEQVKAAMDAASDPEKIRRGLRRVTGDEAAIDPTPAGQVQARPAENPLAEYVNALPEKPGGEARELSDLNFDRIADADDVKATLRSVLEGKTEKVPTMTLQEAQGRAISRLAELGDVLDEPLSEAAVERLAANGLGPQVRVVSEQLGAMREVLASVGAQHRASLERAFSAGDFRGTDAELAALIREQKVIEALGQEVKEVQGRIAQALGEQRIRPTGRAVSIPAKDLDDVAAAEVLEKSGGRAEVLKKLKQDFVLAKQNPDALLPGKPHKRLSMIPEFFINNILSGPITHAVNNTAGLMQSIFLPVERALGSALTGNGKRAAAEMAELFSTASHMRDSLRIAGVAFSDDAARLLPDAAINEMQGARRAISAAGQGLDPDSVGGAMLDAAGKVINIWGRLLMTEDEFWKQLAYRRRMQRRITEIGFQRFSDGAERANFIERTMRAMGRDGQLFTERALYDQGLRDAAERGLRDADAAEYAAKYVADHWDDEVGRAAQDAAQEARVATFTQDLNKAAGDNGITNKLFGRSVRGELNSMSVHYADYVQNHPYLRFITPFVRTPVNLLNFYLDRSFGAVSDGIELLRRKWAAEAVKPDQAADVLGRLATGTAITATAAMYASAKDEDGLPMLTGAGPEDPDERAFWESQGWQPYSMRVGDKYVSYRRFDPFATFLGVVADVVQIGQRAQAQNQSPEWLQNVVVAMIENLGNKTYLAGLTTLFNVPNDPARGLQQAQNQLARGFAPFSAFTSQAVNPYLSDDRYLLEVRTMFESFARGLPGGNTLIEKRRDLFGAPIEKSRGIGPDFLSPLAYTEVKDDIVARELAQVGARFGPPREQTNGVDWSQYTDSSGQSAYDRWLELHGTTKINGKTLREAMGALIRSRGYQRLSPVGNDELDSPRVAQLRRLVSRYRAVAKRQALREYPELMRDIGAVQHNRALLAQGATPDQLVDLIRR